MISTVNPELSPTIGTVARKRRRQILQSQRKGTVEDTLLSSPAKKRCVESKQPITCDGTTTPIATIATAEKASATKTKKPQMRYDPDVPMSKEEAAAWRKEQRRKRNRESAAASRQRQRDRISELEQEVSEWKTKYEDALARIEKLEQMKQLQMTSSESSASAAVSPCASPRISPCSEQMSLQDQSCGLVSLQDQSTSLETEEGSVSTCEDQAMEHDDVHVKHLSEKISRPA